MVTVQMIRNIAFAEQSSMSKWMWDEALLIIDALLQDSVPTGLQAELMELKGDVLWRQLRVQSAIEAYSTAMSLGIGDSRLRGVLVKLDALQNPDPEYQSVIQTYLNASEDWMVDFMRFSKSDVRPRNNPYQIICQVDTYLIAVLMLRLLRLFNPRFHIHHWKRNAKWACFKSATGFKIMMGLWPLPRHSKAANPVGYSSWWRNGKSESNGAGLGRAMR